MPLKLHAVAKITVQNLTSKGIRWPSADMVHAVIHLGSTSLSSARCISLTTTLQLQMCKPASLTNQWDGPDVPCGRLLEQPYEN